MLNRLMPILPWIIIGGCVVFVGAQHIRKKHLSPSSYPTKKAEEFAQRIESILQTFRPKALDQALYYELNRLPLDQEQQIAPLVHQKYPGSANAYTMPKLDWPDDLPHNSDELAHWLEERGIDAKQSFSMTNPLKDYLLKEAEEEAKKIIRQYIEAHQVIQP